MKKRDFDTAQRFGLRKYKWSAGAVSVLLGSLALFGASTNNTVHADTVNDQDSQVQLKAEQVGSLSMLESHVNSDWSGDLVHNSDGSWSIPDEPGLDDHGNTKHEKGEIDYTGDPNSQTIHYINDDGTPAKDKNGNNIPDSTAGNTDSAKGDVTHSGDTATVQVPDGWKLKNDTDKTTKLMPDANTGKVPDKSVIIEHGEYTTPAGDKSKAGSQIPSTDEQKTGKDNTFARDMGHLTNAHVQETIDYDYSGVNANTKNQDAYKNLSSQDIKSTDYNRTATVDTVTGEVKSYGDWNLENSKIPDYTVHQIAGYTAIVIDESGRSAILNNGVIAGQDLTSSEINKLKNSNGVYTLHNYKVTYKANNGHKVVEFVDENGNLLSSTDNKDQDGKVITNAQVSGIVDEAATTDISAIVPKGWVLAETAPTIVIPNTDSAQNAPIKIKIKHGVKGYNFVADVNISKGSHVDPGDPNSALVSDTISHDTLNKTLTRTFIGTEPDGAPINTVQRISLIRNAALDLVTGKVSFIPWDYGMRPSFDSYTAPAVNGYSALIDNGQAVTDGRIANDEVVNTWDDSQHIHHVTYTANEQTITYKFVDDDDNQKQVGALITLHGKTDTSISIPDSLKNAPTNYELAQGSSLPTDIQFKADNGQMPRVIHLKHQMQDFDVNDIPNGAIKDDGSTVTTDDMQQSIHRTIIVNLPLTSPGHHVIVNPDGTQNVPSQVQNKVETQTVYRDGVMDKVTHKVTFKSWKKTSWSAISKDEFNNIPGFAPLSGVPEEDNVSVDYVDSKPQVSYKALSADRVIHYVDEKGNAIHDVDDNGNIIKDKTITGVTSQLVDVDSPIPSGWVLVNNDDISAANHVDLSNPVNGHCEPLTIKIKHGVVTIDHTKTHTTGELLDPSKPNGPKFNGVSDSDLNQVSEREFDFILPAGIDAQDFANKFNLSLGNAAVTGTNKVTVKQDINFVRDAVVDKITGQVVGYMVNGELVKDNDNQHGWYDSGKTNGTFSRIDIPILKGYTPHVKDLGTSALIDNGIMKTLALYKISFVQSSSSSRGEDSSIGKDQGQTGKPDKGNGEPKSGAGHNASMPDNSNPGQIEHDDTGVVNNNQGGKPIAEPNSDIQNGNTISSAKATPGDVEKGKPGKMINNYAKKRNVAKKHEKYDKTDSKTVIKTVNKSNAKLNKGLAKSENLRHIATAGVKSANSMITSNNTEKPVEAQNWASKPQSVRGFNADKLPQTGEKQNSFGLIAGSLALAIGLFGLVIDRRKKRD